VHDLRLAVRSLGASPMSSWLAVLSLALGIGANTAIFSLIDGLLLRTLPVRDPASLVLVSDDSGPGIRSYPYDVWQQIHQRAELFDGTLAWAPWEFGLTSRGEIQVVDGVWVSGSFFDVLGVVPWLGRTLSELDDRRDGGPNGPAAVISYGFWQRRFGGAADVIGRALTLDEIPFTVVGVTPPNFFGADVGRAFDVIIPLGTEPLVRGRESAIAGGGCCLGLTIIARLKAGEPAAAATVALRGVQPQIREATMPQNPRWRQQDRDRYLRDAFTLVPGGTGNSRLRLRYARPLLTVMVVVALVLLIACANVANLLLARAVARRHELYVRLALGASRWRLVRQLFTESVVLAGVGAVPGVLLASWGSRLLVRQLSTQASSHASTGPVSIDLSIDVTVLAFAIAVTVLVTLLVGVAPAFRAVRAASGADVLRSQTWITPTDIGGARVGAAGVILVAQVALSVVLVVAAGLFLRTFVSLERLPLGFDRDRVLMVNVVAERTHATPDQRPALFERARHAVRALPGVTDTAFSFITPVSGPTLLRPIDAADGVPSTLPERERMSAVNLVSPSWFHTLGTSIVSGRDFTERDDASAPAVVIVNETFVRKLLHGTHPIGRTLSIGIVGPNAASVEVVGVVADAVYGSLREPVPPTMYLPLTQMRQTSLSSLRLSVRVEQGSPLQLTRSIAAAIGDVDTDLAITFRPLGDEIEASMTQERVVAMLSGFFGVLAMLLAGLGLFAVASFAVSRRRREIGVRMALGASPAGVVRLVLARLALLVILGVAIGAGVSAWASQFVASLLFGLEPRDPATFVGAAGLLIVVGLLAGWLPAWRAVRVDPATVLRSE
jgi:putative ABC transport system permease protein